MVGWLESVRGVLRIASDHRDVLSFPHHHEAKSLQRPDDTSLGSVDRELRHYIAASATKASSTGVSVPKDSGPKVSM